LAADRHSVPLFWRSHCSNRCRLATIALSVAAVDLLSKLWASRALQDGPVDLPGPLDLRLGHNSGVAFSFLMGAPPVLIILLTSALTIFLLHGSAIGSLPLLPGALIAGGAIANIIDRIEAGSVVDMLYTTFWPTFNVADVAISGGMVLWLSMALRNTIGADAPA